MDKKEELAALCGLYCGVCGVYIAHRDDNLRETTGSVVRDYYFESCFSMIPLLISVPSIDGLM